VEREQALIAAQNCVRTPKTLERYAVTALHDPDYNVRYGAVYVLRDLGTNAAGALPDLRQTLTDEAAIVRNASERAIRAIQGVGPSAEDKLDEAASP
jgi:HEAT repeat protein